MNRNEPKILLIDGMALLFRAFYATAATGQFMFNDKGVPTNAVNGYLRHMFLALNHFQPSHLAVCWDMGSKTFRNEIYPDYKGNRSAPPEELLPQFDLAKEVTEAFSIPNIGVVGFEADDCIGTSAHQMKKEAEITVVTGDQDILQILDDQVNVALMKKGFGNYQVFSKELFIEEKGYHPRQLIDVKGLTGDPSDHYPGVRGIGPKTAEKLIREYENVENILQSLHLLTPSQRKKIEEDQDLLLLSKELAEIKIDVPLQFSLNEAEIRFSNLNENEKLEELNIKGMSRILSMVEQWHRGQEVG